MFMSGIVRAILVMSLAGSVLALVFLLIKPLIRHRLPRTAQYCLWLVALAALLLPVSKILVLPEKAAFIAPIYTAVDYNVAAAVTEILRTTSDTPAGLTPTFSASVVPDTSAMADPAATSDPTAALDPASASNPDSAKSGSATSKRTAASAQIFVIFIALYPLGFMLVLLYNIITYAYFMGKIRFRKTASPASYAVFSQLCGGKPAPKLYLSPMAATPMLVGVFRPIVLLPNREYTNAQLKSILLHELTHLRRRDVIVKWLTIFSCALHWFNPIVWLTRREIDRTCELSCDAAVVSGLNRNNRNHYGRTLILMAADMKAPRAVLSTTLCEERRDLKERLHAITNHKPLKGALLVVSTVAIMAAMGTACLLGASTGNAAASPLSGASAGNSNAVFDEMSDEDTLSTKYTLIYDFATNGGSSATKTMEIIAGGVLVDLSPQAMKDGWRFVGWNTDPYAVVGLTAFTMPASDMILYAVYEKLPAAPPTDDSNLIPNGDFELPLIPFVNFGNADLNGTNTFTLDTVNVKDGKASLRIQQETRNAFAGYPVSLERDATYDFSFDILILYDSDGNPVSDLPVVRNFVFADSNAWMYNNQNHLLTVATMSSGEWRHISGSYVPDSSRLHPGATPENAYFAIYVAATGPVPDGKPVTYVIDNVRLVKRK